MPTARSRPKKRPASRRGPKGRDRSHFVGREGSPVLEKYPPKDPSLVPRGPPTSPSPASPPAVPKPATVPSTAPSIPPSAPAPAVAKPLIALERPFDVDEFAQLLGETRIQVTVPREELPEVLRRVSDFMGFGIYVYSIRVRPAPEELLRKFVVELERVDYNPARGDWVTFQEQGRSESPFGPSGQRR